MAVRDDFAPGEVLASADLNDTFASKLDVAANQPLQVRISNSATAATTTSTTFVNLGERLRVSITPSATANKIVIYCSFTARVFRTGTGTIAEAEYRLVDQDTNPISGAEQTRLALNLNPSPNTIYETRSPIVLIGFATPASTNEQTYELQHRVSFADTTSQISSDLTRSRIYAWEIS